MTPEKEGSLQRQAYQHIRQKIVSCQYAPNQMLSESQLREELGFSRTPVREAVGRLVQEGLLTVFPKRGIVVSGISIGDVHKIFEVRILVEPHAIRTRHDAIDMAQMEAYAGLFQQFSPSGTERQESESFYQWDDNFHRVIIQALDNEYLLELYSRIQTQNTRLRIMSGKAIQSCTQTAAAEHTRIADACLAQDWAGAARALEEHLICARDSALSTLLKQTSLTGI